MRWYPRKSTADGQLIGVDFKFIMNDYLLLSAGSVRREAPRQNVRGKEDMENDVIMGIVRKSLEEGKDIEIKRSKDNGLVVLETRKHVVYRNNHATSGTNSVLKK